MFYVMLMISSVVKDPTVYGYLGIRSSFCSLFHACHRLENHQLASGAVESPILYDADTNSKDASCVQTVFHAVKPVPVKLIVVRRIVILMQIVYLVSRADIGLARACLCPCKSNKKLRYREEHSAYVRLAQLVCFMTFLRRKSVDSY